jgi:hypothetical protein
MGGIEAAGVEPTEAHATNRRKSGENSSCNEPREEAAVPCGGFTPETVGIIFRCLADQIIRHVPSVAKLTGATQPLPRRGLKIE